MYTKQITRPSLSMKVELESKDLIVGHVYKGKNPRKTGSFLEPVWNDREVVWIGIMEVQYDGPTVKTGQKFPRVSIEKFLGWASEDITDQMIDLDGNWRPIE